MSTHCLLANLHFPISSKPEIARKALTFSLVSFSFYEARKGWRPKKIPRCAVEESPLVESEVGFVQGRFQDEDSVAVVVRDRRFDSIETRMRLRLGSRSFDRRPLWKRIFFASKKVRSIILLNVLTVIYASDIPVLKEVEEVTEPAFFAMVRFVVSVIPFLPFVFKERDDHRTRSSGVELGLWVSFGYLTQALGLLTSDAGRASFISAFTVLVVPLIDGMFGATIPPLIWSGAFFSLVGVAMLESGGSPPCVGDFLTFLSTVFFGIHMLRTEQISKNTKKEKVLALLGFEVSVVALSSIIWFMIKDILGDVHQLSFHNYTWSTLWDWTTSFPWIPALYTGVLSTGSCLWAEMYAMKNVSATESAVIYGLEPLWGAAFAWFLLGERWDTNAWIGAALILGSCLTVQILGSPSEKLKKVKSTTKSIPLKPLPKQNHLSFSTVVINPRENLTEQFKRKDKL
ncbi:uncharacterized protein [Typha angustifolia]|uniref:uncharacterized protein n=1 Tax=Typha angustifolia TaxID=59011 RepID=UPI003C2C508C